MARRVLSGDNLVRSRKTGARWPSGRHSCVLTKAPASIGKALTRPLETVGIRAKVVNARHVKNVPGRKTDISDAQWLATLSRAGLLRASFIPNAKICELRLIAR